MGFSLLPKEERFVHLLHESALNVQQASIALQDLFSHFTDVPNKVAKIKALEENGDQLIHEIFQVLHRTFVTPIDREDIGALAERIDDIIDAIDEACNYLVRYKIAEPTIAAQELAGIITKCADELVQATELLRYGGGKLKAILPHTVELNRLENEADQILGRVLGELFNESKDPIYIMKWRDIYDDLEGATDRAEDAANVLEGIVLKNA